MLRDASDNHLDLPLRQVTKNLPLPDMVGARGHKASRGDEASRVGTDSAPQGGNGKVLLGQESENAEMWWAPIARRSCDRGRRIFSERMEKRVDIDRPYK